MKLNKLRRPGICLLIFIFVFSMSIPAYAVGVDNPPTPYPYGLSSLADDKLDAQQMLVTEWEAWKDRFISKSGSKRVLFEDGVSTVSEGMGYGLLLSVYFNEQALFDELYAYVKSCVDDKGLMNWKTNNGQVTGAGSATDADQNIALALVFADKVWGSGGAVDYETEGKQMLSKIYQYEISGGQVKPGDAFTDPRNPSYLAPAAYEIFGDFDQSHDWSSVKSNAYSLIKKTQHSTTGLVPNWCSLSGQPQSSNASSADEFGYDATVFQFNMAVAYSWYGHADAKAICSKPMVFFKNIGAANIVDGYKLNGTPIGTYHVDAFVATAAAGFMTGTDRQTAKGFYNECTATKSSNYYGSTLRLFALMYMTGNLQNLYEGGTQIVESADSVTEDDTATEDEAVDEVEPETATEETDMQITLKATGELGAVKLDWDRLEGAQGYYIYKSRRSGGQGDKPETDFCVIGTTYNDAKVIPGIQYYYIVKPVMKDQSLGEASNEAAATSRGKAQGTSLNTTFTRPLGKSGTIELTIGSTLMKASGKTKAIDATKGTTPVISAGRAFVPVNAIIGEMGGKVLWNSKEQKVTINVSENTVELWMGKTTISVNGVKKTIDAAPYLSKTGTPMLPLRFVMENLGCELVWENGKTQSVTIVYDFN